MCKGMFGDGNGARRRPPSAELLESSSRSTLCRSGVSSLFGKVTIDTEWGEMEDYEEIAGGPMLLSVTSPERSSPPSAYGFCSLPTSPCSSAAWFDVRVVYVRVTGCSSVEEAPEFLTIRFPSRSISTALEVNGGRISPLEEASVVLRRDRVDSETVEATYVSTDNLRMSGSLHYEVFNNQEPLVCGDLDYVESKYEPGLESPSRRTTNSNCGAWSMDCTCLVGQSGCAFLRGRHYDYAAAAPSPPASTDMEICVVGRHLDTPVFLTQTVHLTARRRSSRLLTLDAIPETGELCKHHSNGTILIDSPQLIRERNPFLDLDDRDSYTDINDKAAVGLGYGLDNSFYGVEGEDGQMTWFNAGVRVGVGIGLGMCLGAGIGIGLMVRTYQTTTKTFRRGFI